MELFSNWKFQTGGVSYTGLFEHFEIQWEQLERAEIYSPIFMRVNKFFSFYTKSNKRPKVMVSGFGLMTKAEHREFFEILKWKAPAAVLAPEILEFLK